MTRIIIVGASGVIGSVLHQEARTARVPAIGTALSRVRYGLVPFDMRTASLRTVVPDLNADDVVVLLAGYIAPAWIYANQEAAWLLNLHASKNLVDDADDAGARVVFLSTDQVFDGKAGDCSEDTARRPLNVYGALKAAVESHVLCTPRGVVARTGWNVGWVQGQHCPVAQCYETLLKPNARMAVDNIFNVSDVNDTARGLLEIATKPVTRRIYHLVSQPAVSRAELAQMVKEQSLLGARMAFEPVPFSEIVYSEPRPLRASLKPTGGMATKFTPSIDVIAYKVARIDRWRFRQSFGGRVAERLPVN
jgi:dTDP-4-dehydrorhamnose reductase